LIGLLFDPASRRRQLSVGPICIGYDWVAAFPKIMLLSDRGTTHFIFDFFFSLPPQSNPLISKNTHPFSHALQKNINLQNFFNTICSVSTIFACVDYQLKVSCGKWYEKKYIVITNKSKSKNQPMALTVCFPQNIRYWILNRITYGPLILILSPQSPRFLHLYLWRHLWTTLINLCS